MLSLTFIFKGLDQIDYYFCNKYGNFYLGQPLNVNYLGRMEGMPGGSGTPPINRF